jgi:hypothetical protein
MMVSHYECARCTVDCTKAIAQSLSTSKPAPKKKNLYRIVAKSALENAVMHDRDLQMDNCDDFECVYSDSVTHIMYNL